MVHLPLGVDLRGRLLLRGKKLITARTRARAGQRSATHLLLDEADEVLGIAVALLRAHDVGDAEVGEHDRGHVVQQRVLILPHTQRGVSNSRVQTHRDTETHTLLTMGS